MSILTGLHHRANQFAATLSELDHFIRITQGSLAALRQPWTEGVESLQDSKRPKLFFTQRTPKAQSFSKKFLCELLVRLNWSSTPLITKQTARHGLRWQGAAATPLSRARNFPKIRGRSARAKAAWLFAARHSPRRQPSFVYALPSAAFGFIHHSNSASSPFIRIHFHTVCQQIFDTLEDLGNFAIYY